MKCRDFREVVQVSGLAGDYSASESADLLTVEDDVLARDVLVAR